MARFKFPECRGFIAILLATAAVPAAASRPSAREPALAVERRAAADSAGRFGEQAMAMKDREGLRSNLYHVTWVLLNQGRISTGLLGARCEAAASRRDHATSLIARLNSRHPLCPGRATTPPGWDHRRKRTDWFIRPPPA
jgi:hypothetical protein